jgi:hypothetical protein
MRIRMIILLIINYSLIQLRLSHHKFKRKEMKLVTEERNIYITLQYNS